MEKINVAELLKDCPKGMELDCVLYDDVYFDYIDDVSDIINCYIQDSKNKIGLSFSKYGHYSNINKTKCVIFPKGKTTWEGFHRPFKDGDILYIRSGSTWICIYKEGGETANVYYKHVATNFSNLVYDDIPLCHREHVKEIRFATEKEKQKLFQVIKDNGYKWNAETKTLEKLVEPKFKVGDKITDKNKFIYRITEITDKGYKLHDLRTTFITFEEADLYFVKVVDIFDITTLKPFDKVLVRDTDKAMWIAALFSYLRGTTFYTVGGWYNQCIPFEGNQHLLGTTNDCDEFYKTWTNEED